MEVHTYAFADHGSLHAELLSMWCPFCQVPATPRATFCATELALVGIENPHCDLNDLSDLIGFHMLLMVDDKHQKWEHTHTHIYIYIYMYIYNK